MAKLLTKEQIGEIVAKGGAGMTAERVVAAAKRHGYDIEGDPMPNPPPETKLAQPTGAVQDTTQVQPVQPMAAAQAPGVPTPQASAPAENIPSVPQAPAPAPTNWGKMATNAIPMVAGGVGGIMGGIPGAALGGLAGEGLREGVAGIGKQFGQDLGEVPTSKGDFANRIGTAALEQTGSELGGRVIGAGLKVLARGPMMAALRRVKIGDTNLGKVALDERIPVTQKGLEKLNKKIDVWKTERAAHLDAAGKAGHVFQPADLAYEAARRVMREVKGAPKIKRDEIKAIKSWAKQFTRDNPDVIDPNKLLELRQIADDIATPIYKNIEAAARGKGQPVEALTKIEGRLNRELAKIARTHLNNIGPKGAHGKSTIEYATNQLEKLTHLKQALSPLVEKGMPLAGKVVQPGVGAGLGAAVGGAKTHSPQGALAGAAIGAGAAHPATLSHMALLMSNPALANLILPNLLRAGYHAGTQE